MEGTGENVRLGMESSRAHSSSSGQPPLSAFRERVRAALERAIGDLLAARTPSGHWEGTLSSSALSTATAVIALAVAERSTGPTSSARRTEPGAEITKGLKWLADHANPDGGWGDTTSSRSNISTTSLCWAAFGAVPGAGRQYAETVQGAERWLEEASGSAGATDGSSAESHLDHERLVEAILRRYGEDRTFSVPILTACALSGRLGAGREAWHRVLPLPFELAALPRQWFATVGLPVVSYALPALIAIGQVRHFHRPTRNPLLRLLRHVTRGRTLEVLKQIQPSSGGFLEATPLTSFVVMSLAGMGLANHPVARQGLGFLRQSQRPDGSWPIDTNLATWVTTLAVNALSVSCPHDTTPWTLPAAMIASIEETTRRAATWIEGQQHLQEHPYTGAAPGGWAWTDLPGGVPDADDTSGALLALHAAHAGGLTQQQEASVQAGVRWLLSLQNRDGGIPTFCRGWGKLPFDHSSADITAHAIRAWQAWLPALPAPLQQETRDGIQRALDFLRTAQKPDGSWVPLWFGNQHCPNDENRTYGTARVVQALAGASMQFPEALPLRERGAAWLLAAQNPDGSWGGDQRTDASIEETALALEALASLLQASAPPLSNPDAKLSAAVLAGAEWLGARVESGQWKQPSPIGFYFASLWYHEALYPQAFTVEALGRVCRVWDRL